MLSADKDLRQINDMVPFGCNFTMMIDSCNSGGMLNGAIEQHCDFSVTNKLVKDLKGATENGKALGTLISACQGFEYAVDAGAVCRESRRCHSPLIITLLRIFRKKGYSFTNGELVAELRKLMHTSPFSQRPGLFCTDFQAQSTFLGPVLDARSRRTPKWLLVGGVVGGVVGGLAWLTLANK